MNSKVNKLVTASMLAALTCIATMIIKVPTVGTNGYVNIGDSIVLLSTWLMGNPYGAVAAGIGSGLADLISGYASYVPGTVIIKFLMSFVAFIVYKLLNKTKAPKIVNWVVSGVVAELIMVFGYFSYESTFLGYGLAAAASIPSNLIQGITCLVIGTILIAALSRIKFFKELSER
ncbi:MAG: ECF transporter S component [Lachnospiraceae bacterium]|nr:ECF transporter S component [Lachnospiraceae bacterium]